MQIGKKIKSLRIRCGLTQEELANRCELTKGFISQLERDITSPSIATLCDIVESLGTDLPGFFAQRQEQLAVYSQKAISVLDDEKTGVRIDWLVPNAQKNMMEPILVTLKPESTTEKDEPHAGEEFGYILSGAVTVVLGDQRARARKGESFYMSADEPHWLENPGKAPATVLWVSSPPSF